MDKSVTLREAIDTLNEATTNVLAHFDALEHNPQGISYLLTSFKKLKDNLKELEDSVQILSQLKDKLNHETIPDALKAEKLNTAGAGGFTFSLATRTLATIPEHKREAGLKWLADVAGIPELIKQTVNPRQLSSFIKDYIETNAQFPPEEAVSVHLQDYIMVRKQ